VFFLVTAVEPVFGALVFAVWVYYAMRRGAPGYSST
jgi:hypothetical protein